MTRIGSKSLASYMEDDWVIAAFRDAGMPEDGGLTCQRWIAESPAKRFAFARLYGDLVCGGQRRVLDVGGGLSSLTRLLVRQNHYELIDFLAHDDPSMVSRFLASTPAFRIVREDWYEVSLRNPYDIVVAADLFPNVDQRLTLFLDRMLPIAREVRLSLTVYNQPRFYLTKRIGADEMLCMLAWDGRQTRSALERFADRLIQADLNLLDIDEDSVYPNGRQVYLAVLKGDA